MADVVHKSEFFSGFVLLFCYLLCSIQMKGELGQGGHAFCFIWVLTELNIYVFPGCPSLFKREF